MTDHTTRERLAAAIILHENPERNALTRPDDPLVMVRVDPKFFICAKALRLADALIKAGLVPDATTTDEWNVNDDGLGIYLHPWCEQREIAEEYVESGRVLVHRQRTTFTDRVTVWEVAR